MRYNQLTLMLLMSMATANAQNVTLANPWQKNSANLYIGVQNVLLIKGQSGAVLSFTSNESSLKRVNDSLVITLLRPGPIKIETLFNNGTRQAFWFEGKYLPPLDLQLTANNWVYEKELNKAALEHGCALQISASDKSLYEDYAIIAFSIAIDGEDFCNTDAVFSKQTIQALKQLQPGHHFSVKEISLHNKTTGKTLLVMASHKYKVL